MDFGILGMWVLVLVLLSGNRGRYFLFRKLIMSSGDTTGPSEKDPVGTGTTF